MNKTFNLYLPDFIEDHVAEELLDLSSEALFNKSLDLIKSMYDFDISTEGGMYRLLGLLPVLDQEVIKVVVQDIWPGYPVDQDYFDTNFARAEVRGYLLGLVDSPELSGGTNE